MSKCKCDDIKPPLQVCHSNAGYYVGRFCDYCGPFSRESGYYKTSEDAEKALNSDDFDRVCIENNIMLRE